MRARLEDHVDYTPWFVTRDRLLNRVYSIANKAVSDRVYNTAVTNIFTIDASVVTGYVFDHIAELNEHN